MNLSRMEQPKQIVMQRPLWHEHKVNIIISGLILLIGSFVAVGLMRGNVLKTSLVGSGVVDIQLRAGTVSTDRVGLIWNDTIPSGNNTYYSSEVAYQVRYFTGEVSTAELQNRWTEFTDITADPQGIQESGSEKSVTALGLVANTTYTFGVAKMNASDQLLHFSNALTARTVPSSNPTNNPSSTNSSGLGDTNGDTVLDSTDPYVAVMYIYYNNWSALYASLQAQGVSLSATLTESDFKRRADLDFNCTVNFSDVDIIAGVVNGQQTLPTQPANLDCSY